MRIPIHTFLKDMYGTKTRKGIDKLAYQHAVDVMNNCYIERIADPKKSARIYKAALIHDVGEDSGKTISELKQILGLNEGDVRLLKLLSRNIDNEDGSDYIDGIMKDEEAVIIKFADRISNLTDLILWIKNDNGLTKESLATAKKYDIETQKMLDLSGGLEKAIRQTGDQTLGVQIKAMMDKLKELRRLIKTYPGIV